MVTWAFVDVWIQDVGEAASNLLVEIWVVKFWVVDVWVAEFCVVDAVYLKRSLGAAVLRAALSLRLRKHT